VKRFRTTILSTLVVGAMTYSVWLSGAENRNEFEESVQRRAQRVLLQDNGVNNLSPQLSITKRQASNIASGRFEGRVLSILMDSSSDTWRVRMDRDGTVFNVFVNASSGDVSGTSE